LPQFRIGRRTKVADAIPVDRALNGYSIASAFPCCMFPRRCFVQLAAYQPQGASYIYNHCFRRLYVFLATNLSLSARF
jgi:hypothetical protein